MVYPQFHNTDRDGPQGAEHQLYSGVTDLKIMVPITPGSDTPHPEDELFARDAVRAFSDTFVTFRWNDVNGTGDLGNAAL